MTLSRCTVIGYDVPLVARVRTAPPMSAPKERGSAITRDKDGRERWKNQWTMERTMVDGKAVLRFTEEGRGIRSPYDDEIRWTIVTLWT